MDRPIEKKRRSKLVAASLLAVTALAIFIVYNLYNIGSSRSKTINKKDIVISKVKASEFSQEISFLGEVEPQQVFFIDAIEGGVVKEISAKNGDFVQAGQQILFLSNTSLILEVIRSEAEITQQLNNLNVLEIELERNKLKHLEQILQTNFRIKQTTRQLNNLKKLKLDNLHIEDDLIALTNELEYLREKKDLILLSQKTDMGIQQKQMAQLSENAKSLEDSLLFTKKNLSSLDVKAPVSGLLTDFNLRNGQSLNKGEKIARIDGLDDFILVAYIDEFHIGRITKSAKATVLVNEEKVNLTVRNILPEIKQGKFKVEFKFTEPVDFQLRRGLSLSGTVKLDLIDSITNIPFSGFSAYTGDNWVFVVNEQETKAERRNIIPSKKSLTSLSILEGLKPGEKIITSSYKNLFDVDVLYLSE
ncbi:efflux RND transporter periplasmic adaptor subunit [Pseudoalteromonas sp. MMG012]|uniref:efflux RND transporter periplasmic adaptor subunit n=1 Tax=Pseudoalteromonas sp. MMG012 TaxID=2822686 RepID=UPI001B39FF28|nr:HlyD family efflux transporter periplasmic adaptor subunit [Pseudoalteromonas sp. MMG012]MBQ4851224.1 HlyD family efflux transporter periplasmic adaptor subunit [Pseudoalteromonas sp. MMG012]